MRTSVETGRWKTPIGLLKQLSVVVFSVAVVVYVWYSIRWKLMIDSPILHYVIFLMQHGLKPYVDISDNNMPGAYLTEATAMKVFGAGDLGWRLYEFFLLGCIGGCMMWISRRVDWRAGLAGFGVFLALHAAEGPQYAGERELVITALVMISYVLFFEAVASGRAWPIFIAGLTGGLAAAIKPTFLPFTGLLLICCWIVQRRRGRSPWPAMLAGSAGLVLMGLVCLAFLLYYGALRQFFFLTLHVLPTYAGMSRPTWRLMLFTSLPGSLLFLLALCLPLFWAGLRRGTTNWERWALALGMALGYASYLLQRKGFPDHRYIYEVILLLLIGMTIFEGFADRSWRCAVAVCALAYILVWFTPRTMKKVTNYPAQLPFVVALQADLHALARGGSLDDRVQCFDLVYGCLDALYHEDIVENTGFTGDLLFFSPHPSVAREFYREEFWELARRDPATIMVVSNQTPLQDNGYDKLQKWPEFAAYLNRNYVQVAQRDFTYERYFTVFPIRVPADQADSYRIYVRRDSSLADQARGLLASAPPGTTP